MTDFQALANDVRDRVLEHEAVRRVAIEVLWATGSAQGLTLRARHRDRVLTLARHGAWHERTAEQLAAELAHELIADALGTVRPVPASPDWPHPGTAAGNEPPES